MIKINLINEANKKGASKEGESSAFNFENLFAFKRDSIEMEGEDDFGDSDGLIKIILKLVLMALGAIGLFYHESVNIPRLQGELSDLRSQSAELIQYNEKASKAVAEIKKTQEYKALIEKQIETLDMLSRVRLKFIKVVDLIQTSLPEKMWLTNLRANGRDIELQGVSHTEGEITHFLELLGKSAYLADATMVSSEDVESTDPDVPKFKEFNINITLEDQQ